MKRIYLTLMIFAMMNISFAQSKTTGTVTLSPLMTVKIDKDSPTSMVTITLTGPSTRWFAIGLNAANAMTSGTDCFIYTTSLLDAKIIGQAMPNVDAVNNWTVSSNTVTGTTRTIVATRPFMADATDYMFTYAPNTLNIIWAYAGSVSTNIATQHASNTRGTKALTFTTVLGTEDFAVLDKISVYPNPSTGVFNISKNRATPISKIRVFDTEAKLLKEIDTNIDNQNLTVDLSQLSKGIYFMEISNNEDKTVKKIQID